MALLLVAHGERSSGAANAGVVQLAATLRGRAVAPEVAIGFIKGEPTITESVHALRADEIVVYPLFLSDGYFTRARLPEMLNEAMRADRPRAIRMLPPLGLDPALVPLLMDKLVGTAQGRGMAPGEALPIGSPSKRQQVGEVKTALRRNQPPRQSRPHAHNYHRLLADLQAALRKRLCSSQLRGAADTLSLYMREL